MGLDLRTTEAAKADRLYGLSVPAPEEFTARLAPMFARINIRPPELRVLGNLGNGGAALLSRNAILLGPGALDLAQARLEGVVAHETGHLVFGDRGTSVRKIEFRTDRFARFAAGDLEGFAALLSENQQAFNQELQVWRNGGLSERVYAHMRRFQKWKMYGSLEDRLANLRIPLTDAEIASFTAQIESYNARVAAASATVPQQPTVSSKVGAGVSANTKIAVGSAALGLAGVALIYPEVHDIVDDAVHGRVQPVLDKTNRLAAGMLCSTIVAKVGLPVALEGGPWIAAAYTLAIPATGVVCALGTAQWRQFVTESLGKLDKPPTLEEIERRNTRQQRLP